MLKPFVQTILIYSYSNTLQTKYIFNSQTKYGSFKLSSAVALAASLILLQIKITYRFKDRLFFDMSEDNSLEIPLRGTMII